MGSRRDAPRAGLIGRDRELGELDRLLRGRRAEQAVIVCGPAGVGKTALLREFGQRWNGSVAVYSHFEVDEALEAAETPSLLIIDDVALESHLIAPKPERRVSRTSEESEIAAPTFEVETNPGALRRDQAIGGELAMPIALRELRDYLNRHPATSAILASRSLPTGVWPRVVQLGDLDQASAFDLAHELGLNLSRVKGPLPGLPLLLHLATRYQLTDPDLLDQFRAEHVDYARGWVAEMLVSLDADDTGIVVPQTSILGPDGLPLTKSDDRYERVLLDVREVGDELLHLVATKPELLREIDPRRFEEIVAEILDRMGYETTLTQPSRDGGRDIHAAHRSDIGSFLYLVECKRYSEDNPVGVEVVRQLYGVVAAERATAGLIVTTSRFTRGAQEFQKTVEHQMSLADLLRLQRWLHQIDMI